MRLIDALGTLTAMQTPVFDTGDAAARDACGIACDTRSVFTAGRVD